MRHILSVAAILLLLLLARHQTVGAHAPSVRSAPLRAFIGRIPGKIVWPVVDVEHHRVYGVVGRDVIVLDEMTGRLGALARFPRHHGMLSTSFDPRSGHLIVEDLFVPRVGPNDGGEHAVSQAHLLDARNGRVLVSIPIHRYPVLHSTSTYGGATAVDTALHHGFVIDPYGLGVMLDTRTGAVLARFHSHQPASFNIQRNLAQVDEHTHRLFLGIMANDRAGRQPLVDVIDTTTGRIIHTAYDRSALLIEALVVDQRSDRVFAAHYQRHVLVLDGRSGRVVARPRVGQESYDLAVDPGSGRIFVFASAKPNSSYAELRVLSPFGRLLPHPALRRTTDALERMIVDPRPHRLVMYDGNGGILRWFDSRTLQQVHAAQAENEANYGVALDVRLHRAVISGHFGTTVIDSRA